VSSQTAALAAEHRATYRGSRSSRRVRGRYARQQISERMDGTRDMDAL
jgi:hypothetical protein